MKKYKLTPEHETQLPAWRDQWIANAMSTKPMDEAERQLCREAVKGLYLAANLTPPPDYRIVFVSSPFVLRFAGGFAAATWRLRANKEKCVSAATDAATYAATRDATYDATIAATRAATDDATYDATIAATDAATRAATRAATSDATDAATYDAIYDATYDATRAATYAAIYDATSDATNAATRAATDDATYDATIAATDAATYDATIAATDSATRAATRAATSDATDAATYDAIYDATSDATNAATRAATDDATYDATIAATDAATYDATIAATDSATYDATYDATYAATSAATYAATDAATYAATDAATYAATSAATDSAIKNNQDWYFLDIEGPRKLSFALGLAEFGLKCASSAYSMWQGGNQWSAWASFLGFFKTVVGLNIDYSKYEHFEILAKHSGPRIMHKEFCMISDRPEVLTVDAQNRPHNEFGPFCKWRDGSAIYSLHGIRVPGKFIETPKDQISPKEILALTNTEQRMALMRHVGLHKFLDALNAKEIDARDEYRLLHLTVENQEIGPYLFMKCPSSGREFLEGCGDANKYESIDPTIKTVDDALKWRAMRASQGLMTKFNLKWNYHA